MPRNIRPTVYGLNTSKDKRSRFTGPVRRSRVGHLAPSRTVPTVVRLKPGINEQRPSGNASMWLNGKSAVSKARVCFPRTTQNGPTRHGHIMYENEPVLEPRSTRPSWTGPSLYM